jgi:hypothetical protein
MNGAIYADSVVWKCFWAQCSWKSSPHLKSSPCFKYQHHSGHMGCCCIMELSWATFGNRILISTWQLTKQFIETTTLGVSIGGGNMHRSTYSQKSSYGLVVCTHWGMMKNTSDQLFYFDWSDTWHGVAFYLLQVWVCITLFVWNQISNASWYWVQDWFWLVLSGYMPSIETHIKLIQDWYYLSSTSPIRLWLTLPQDMGAW